MHLGNNHYSNKIENVLFETPNISFTEAKHLINIGQRIFL